MEDGVTVSFPIRRYFHVANFILPNIHKYTFFFSNCVKWADEQINHPFLDVTFESVNRQDRWEQGKKMTRMWVDREWKAVLGK